MATVSGQENQYNPTGLTARTFFNRVYRCYYYKPEITYVRGITLLFNRILLEYRKGQASIIALFCDKFSSRSYTGRNSVNSTSREQFRKHCLLCAANLNNLLSKYQVTNIMECYNLKWSVRGFIHGLIKIKDKTYILSLSFDEINVTKKDIDFFSINSYLYNAANHTSYSTLIMSVPSDVFYTVPYQDYTIKRGFLSFPKGHKIRKHGDYCSTCACGCKPPIINGLERLEFIQ